MIRIAGRFLALAIVLGAIAPATAADRTAEEILKEIAAVKQPRTMEEYKKLSAQTADLIAELKKVAPDNEKLNTLLPQRWNALAVNDKQDEAIAEIDATIASTKNETLKKEAVYSKAQVLFSKDEVSTDAVMSAIDAFDEAAPKDPRMMMVLYGATQILEDPAKLESVEDRLLKDYASNPQIRQIKPMIEAARKMRAKVGKPFELEFTDAIKDSQVSMKDLKGKIVVIDFWATWCGPCIAEMPTMKKLYADYKDKGVEFIGVSLDQPKEMGGLDALKKYVKDNDIQWPQYYQGKGWKSEFSAGWGVNSIPCVFMVDQQGNLYSVKARGKIAKMVPKLLEKGKGAAAGGGR